MFEQGTEEFHPRLQASPHALLFTTIYERYQLDFTNQTA
jgi:hypothetical protein